MRRVRLTIIVVERKALNPTSVRVYSCFHFQACKAHAPYYIFVCGLYGCTNFFTFSHKRHGIRKKVIEHKSCVSILSTTTVQNLSYSKNISVRYYHKYI